MKGFWTFVVRIVLVKPHGKPLDININQAHAQTADGTEDDNIILINALRVWDQPTL